MKRVKNFLHESRSKIGLVHGFISCIGAAVLSYLTSMVLSMIITGNYSLKIVPSMMLVPILMSIYGIWILFSKTRFIALKKVLFTFVLLVLILSILIKVL